MTGLKYISWNDTSGYAAAAYRYIRGLLNQDVPLTWTPMVPGHSWGREFGYEPFLEQSIGSPERDGLCNKDINYDTLLIHVVPEYYPRWMELEPEKRAIGYTTWETDKLPAHWPDILNRLDRVWVPSTWNQQVFQDSGVTVPIDVIPHILGEKPGTGSPHPATSTIPDDHFTFYTVNVWSRRKALWLLLEAYWSTFTRDDKVTLVLKTSLNDGTHRFSHRGFPLNELARTRRTFQKLAAKFPNRPATVLIAEENTPQPAIDALHHQGDCYISLTRSEGWGLGAFDAVAAGKPIIMTGYGGQTDFLPAEHAYLVDHRLTPVDDAPNKKFYSPDQHWAEPDLKHAGQLMREVFENQSIAQAKGQQLNHYANKHFSEKLVTSKLLDILNHE